MTYTVSNGTLNSSIPGTIPYRTIEQNLVILSLQRAAMRTDLKQLNADDRENEHEQVRDEHDVVDRLHSHHDALHHSLQ